MNIKKYFYLAAGLSIMPLAMNGQTVDPASGTDQLYNDARQSFLRKEYSISQQMLNKYLKQTHSTAFKSEADYMLACTAYELKQPNSMKLLNEYLENYPESRYNNRINGLVATLYFDEGKYLEAIATYRGCNFEYIEKAERSEFILRLATAYLKIDNIKEATFWFNILKDTNPAYRSDAVYHLAYIDYSQRNYSAAMKGFEEASRSAKYQLLAQYYMADIYLAEHNYSKAKEMANHFLKHHQNHEYAAEMSRISGEASYMTKEYQTAIKLLENYKTFTTQPQREALYKLGMSYYYTGTNTKATHVLAEVTGKNDALTQNAFLHMGLAYVQLREHNQARMSFEQAAASSFDIKVKEQALYNYALSIHETTYSPFAESVKVFERFVNEFPNSIYTSKVNDYLIEVYMNTRSYDVALQSIAKIKYPDHRILEAKQKLLFRLGTQSFAQGKFEEAISHFSNSLTLGRYNTETKAKALYWRGESKYRLEQYQQASNDLTQYLEFSRNKVSEEYGLALYNLGYASFKLKRYERALYWFKRCSENYAITNNAVKADTYNRMGDCHFYNRNFGAAADNYAMATKTDPSFGDYSLFQEAFVRGLQRDYTGKIRILNQLITDYPSSQYIDDALYEQGRSFVQIKDNANAIGRYQQLVNIYPESTLARKAASETGLLYYQDDMYDKAIEAYKKVISNYPGSEEARLAQRDLKSIYIDLNKVDDYMAFASTIPGGVNFDINERDSLTYVAAERVYLRGEMAEAQQSFERYLQSFPQGAFSVDASYYIGLIAYNSKDMTKAEQYLDKVTEFPDSKFSTQAMKMNADIAYGNQQYDKALSLFKRLADKSTSPVDKIAAETGVLRSAHYGKDMKEVIGTASAMIGRAKLAPELENEARYYRAQAFIASGMEADAVKDYQFLAKDTRNIYGAEAKYKVAQYYFDHGETTKAEKEILEYIEVSTPHAYWLARGFVLLSDVYVKLDRRLEAKQYLLSLQQNYQANDDIAGMIDQRLEKLNAENKQ